MGCEYLKHLPIEGGSMLTKKFGIALFVIGGFFLFIHSILPFLWNLLGIPSAYPLTSSEGIWFILPAFTLPIGGILLILAGLLYGKEERM